MRYNALEDGLKNSVALVRLKKKMFLGKTLYTVDSLMCKLLLILGSWRWIDIIGTYITAIRSSIEYSM